MKNFLIIAFALPLALAGTVLPQGSNPLHITCPPNRTHWVCGGSFAFVNYAAPTTTGSCSGVATVTCTPPSGALFTLGTTLVTCRATNSCRESATCTFTVTVAHDTTPPVIQCPPSLTVVACATSGTTVNYPTPTATDNADTNVVVACSPPTGSVFPIGNTTVTCTATDNCTNQSVCTFRVQVVRDTTPPVIQCPTNFTVRTCSPTGEVVRFPAPTATDNFDATPSVVCSPPSGSILPLGATTVTCVATDDCDNRSTCTFAVTVRPPLLYNGLCHSPLGLAALNVNTNGELEVTGSGTNGQDGVRIELGESQGVRWRVNTPPGQPDGDHDVRVFGRTTAGTEVLLGRMTYQYRGSRLSLRPGAPSYKFELKRRGEVVYQQNGRTGEIEIPECHHVTREECVGEPFEEDLPNWHLPWCIDFLTVECDWDTAIGPVRADALVITPEDPVPADALHLVATVTQIKSFAAPITLHSERLLLFGNRDQAPLPHRALGQARLVAEGGALTVADLGPGGGNGVSVAFDALAGIPDLPPVRGYEVALQPVLLATGEELKTAAYSRLNGEPAAWLGTLALRQISTAEAQLGGECAIFWHIKREEVYRAGQVVGGATIPIADPLSTLKADGTGMPRLTRIAKLPGLPLAFALTFDRTGTFTFHNGTRLIGDEIRVLFFNRPEDAAELSSLDITSTGSSPMTITAERLLTPLGLACPPDITRRVCSTNPVSVNFPPPVVSGGSCTSPATVVCMPPSGSLFPLGTNAVLCTATNLCGESAVCSFTVTVLRDTTPPVITCPSNIVLRCLCTNQIIVTDFFKAEAVDDFDPNPTVVCDPPSLVSSPGVHPVTCTATDNCGNRARCTFTVTFLYDTAPPVIQCPANISVTTCSNTLAVNYSVPATDDCGGTVTVVCAPPSGSQFPVGVTVVNCTATDRCGNQSECRFTVTIKRGLVFLSEIEPNNALASAQDLGQPHFIAVVGRVSVAGDVDYYRFTAGPNAKAWITVDTGGIQWLGANSRDSVLTLHNAAGVALESDDNDGSGNGADSVLESGDASAIAGAALAGGTYYLSVSAAAGQIIAPYRLYLTVTTNDPSPEVEPNATAATATTLIAPGLTHGVCSASLSPTGDADWYTVSVPGPSLLHVSVDGDPERDGTGTDTRVDLFRKDGVSLLFSANSSSAGGAVAEGFVYRLSLPGTYYLRVRAGGTAAINGTYRVMAVHCPLPPPPPLGIALRRGGLMLSWPAALEPCLFRSSRDLRQWSFVEVTPMADGDQLRVELPSSFPQQFFQLVPAGGWSNDSYHCCDSNGQNCSDPVDPLTACPNLLWCHETDTQSVCEPQ